MSATHDPIERGALARRLNDLRVPGAAGAAGRAISAYHAGAQPRRRWRRPPMVALAAVVVLAVLAASPAVQAATGGIAAHILELAGIAPGDAGKVSYPDAVAASDRGYTVTLDATYGDQFHTVLFLSASPKAKVQFTELTDESGRSLGHERSGSYLEYPGLAPGRHQMTLHVKQLDTSSPGDLKGRGVNGDWVLRFPLDVNAVQAGDAKPVAGDLGHVHIAVNEVGGSGEMLYLHLETTGATTDELDKSPSESDFPKSGRSQPYSPPPDRFQFQVLDANGHALTIPRGGPDGSIAGKGGDGPRDVHWRAYYRGAGPGTYQVVVTYEGHRFESHFTIH